MQLSPDAAGAGNFIPAFPLFMFSLLTYTKNWVIRRLSRLEPLGFFFLSWISQRWWWEKPRKRAEVSQPWISGSHGFKKLCGAGDPNGLCFQRVSVNISIPTLVSRRQNKISNEKSIILQNSVIMEPKCKWMGKLLFFFVLEVGGRRSESRDIPY